LGRVRNLSNTFFHGDQNEDVQICIWAAINPLMPF
jgi:hypothetical protein